MALGRRLTELRLARSESLQETADAVNASKAHIWEIEKGKAANPSMDLVRRLADHFNVSIAYLVGEDKDAPDADTELQLMFRQVANLKDNERKIIHNMIQSLLDNRGP